MAERPQYIQITPVQESYVDSGGKRRSVDLPLVTLPPGTILFRGMKIPRAEPREFYRDFLGNPEGAGEVCITPTHNTFFYTLPYIAFGASDVGVTFDMMQIVVLVHPVNVVCSVSPAPWVRGSGKKSEFSGTAPYQRCDKMKEACHPLTAKEVDALSYDNCLTPEYQMRSGTRGWMAIGEQDSFKPRDFAKSGKTSKQSSMGAYLLGLEQRLPGTAKELLTNSYIDANKIEGFPEVVLYPYKTHKGPVSIKQNCSSQ